MGITIDDVARAAGVSTATVSRAMHRFPNMRPETRSRVLQVAAELGYTPSYSAASLATGRTRTVALIVPSIDRWFFANAIEGAERALREADFDALLFTVAVRPDRPRNHLEPEALRRRVDAVIVAGLALSASECERLRSLDLPVVFISVGQPTFTCVGIDDALAAQTAVGHVIELGHRRIAHIGGSLLDDAPWSPAVRRREGWQKTLRANGLDPDPELDEAGHFNVAGGRAAIEQLLRKDAGMTAVFAASDEMAMGAMWGLRDAGVRVPGDVSVVGIDGHDLGTVMGLTTVSQPALAQGAQAAQQVLIALSGGDLEPAEEVLFTAELVVRTSTAPPRVA